jgi:hypothetical protein
MISSSAGYFTWRISIRKRRDIDEAERGIRAQQIGRPGAFDADLARADPAFLQADREQLRPLIAGVGAIARARVLGVERVVANGETAALRRHLQVIGGKLVEHHERVAALRHHDRHRPLPRLDIEMPPREHKDITRGIGDQRLQPLLIEERANPLGTIGENIEWNEWHWTLLTDPHPKPLS